MGNNLMQADLSVWGMYHHADIVVKVVMIGLILASVVTWAIFFGKGAEILASKRRLKREQLLVAEARSLDQASDIANGFDAKSLTSRLINEAQNELELSAGSEDNEGIKEYLPRRSSTWRMTRSTFCSLISLSAPTAAADAKRSSALAGWAAVAAVAGALKRSSSKMLRFGPAAGLTMVGCGSGRLPGARSSSMERTP